MASAKKISQWLEAKPQLPRTLSLTCTPGPNGLAMGTGGCATALQDSLGGQNVVLLAWGRIQNYHVNTCVDLGLV